MTATFGDGWKFSLANLLKVITFAAETCDSDFNWNLPESEPRNENKDSHENSEPELLNANERIGVGPPDTLLDIVKVAKNDKRPGGLKIY